ncbi:uncharacterized protein [Nicotiana tomentosiformis]|uniref:uncharacterized protein n=1 Tax=Nicotiana tomentosiformis TaxID=4098 RepID=UPI00388C99A0
MNFTSSLIEFPPKCLELNVRVYLRDHLNLIPLVYRSIQMIFGTLGKLKKTEGLQNLHLLKMFFSAVHPVTSDKSRNAMTSLKSGDLNGIHATDGESAKVRRSLKGVHISKKKGTLMSSRSANDSPYPDFVDKIVKKSRYSSPSLPIHLPCQTDRGLHSRIHFGCSKNPIALSDKGFEVVVCDFKMKRYMRKFQVDQVWALYGQDSALPKTYGQIKKIISAPLKLHVALLKACAWPKSAAQSVCGTFKVQNEKCQVYAPSSFSHVVKAVSINRNMFEIYPREGEIWALYKNWNKSGLDPDKPEYEIVEVFENSKDRIKVSSIVHGNGFKLVFGSPRKQRSNSDILEIQNDEFGRFSHQIPAF